MSLVPLRDDPVVLITLILLITVGGLGFFVWEEVLTRTRMKRLSAYTKLVLLMTVGILVVGTGLFLVLEWNNPETLGGLSVGSKILNGIFQTTTLRTAGFFTVDQAGLTDAGKAVSMVIMLIGGSSGSTAGGVKTVTFLVLILFLLARSRGQNTVNVFKRSIPQGKILDAATIVSIMVAMGLLGAIVITATCPVSFTDALFEAVSALSTAGVTAGATPLLTIPAQLMIIVFMYFGRVGILTISLGFLAGNKAEDRYRYADANLLIG
jgi:trk system potassium uptake protein TrkH